MSELGDLVGPQLEALSATSGERQVSATELRDLFGSNRKAAEAIRASDPGAPKIESLMRNLQREQKGERGESGQTRGIGKKARGRYTVLSEGKKSALAQGANVTISGTLKISKDKRRRKLRPIHISPEAVKRILDSATPAVAASRLWAETMAAYGMVDSEGKPTMVPAGDTSRTGTGDSAGSIESVSIEPGEAPQ
jgi:hypothetical protein